ncbi:MAG: DUF1573 domain-containing protein [Candidatus Omnitrophica bacterium]|nr:DUF1573 domain-containing protein [Candidatus Omnitrophota bacterium]
MKYFFLFLFLIVSVRGEVMAAPKAGLDCHEFDFGEVTEGDVIEKSFILTNRGDEDLIIRGIHSACSCTTVSIESYNLKPKEKTNFNIIYNTKGMDTGKDDESIYIISNDPISEMTKFTIFAQILERKEALNNDNN